MPFKANGCPHDSPVPRVFRIRRRKAPLQPRFGGAHSFPAAKRLAAGALHRRKKLAARLGAWAETRACALNRSPKPSLANSLAFEADARVVSPKAVNGELRASVQFAALQCDQSR